MVVATSSSGGPSTASTSTSLGEKSSSKVSCLNCRAAKRKCNTVDASTTCKRCLMHGLDCEYKEHRRGRVKKGSISGRQGGNKLPSASPPRAPQPPMESPTLHSDVFLENQHESQVFGELQKASDRPDGLPNQTHLPDILSGFGPSSIEPSRPWTNVPVSEPQTSSLPRPDIHFSHVIPQEGESMPFLPGSRTTATQVNNAPSPSDRSPFEQTLATDSPDPIAAGLLSETDCYELFEMYFRHLNTTVTILDPVLHTPSSCRDKSTLLFTAVLTVTAKIIRPRVYTGCLALANKLLGQAVEFGLCSLETILAISLLTHWKKPDDTTSWRRMGYAIRMAQELRLDRWGPRPLPNNERQAREVLAKERAWLYLLIADYHLAIHHSLPKMIVDEASDDPLEWINEHPSIHTPGEAFLAAWVAFSRMCRLYADMLSGMSGDPANLRLLDWTTLQWKRWRKRWLERAPDFGFLPHQIPNLKLFDALFRFHICEYRLLFNARYQAKHEALNTNDPTPLTFAFVECAEAALALIQVFQNEFAVNHYLPYCLNLVWVALAITAIWLMRNLNSMRPPDRLRALEALAAASQSTGQASLTSDDMPAYTHRLLRHLLEATPPLPPPTASPVIEQRANRLPNDPITQHLPVAALAPNIEISSQQLIHDTLWNGMDTLGTGGGTASNDATMDAGQADEVLFPVADDQFWKMLFPGPDGMAI